jgi:hypothetical protein
MPGNNWKPLTLHAKSSQSRLTRREAVYRGRRASFRPRKSRGSLSIMSFQYERDDSRRRITIRVTGSFDMADVFGIVDRHRAEKVWGYAMLYDLTNLIEAPDSSEVARASDYVQRYVNERPRGPVAFVAPQPSTFGMVRMYSLMNDRNVNVGAFHTVAAAERWLDEQAPQPVT